MKDFGNPRLLPATRAQAIERSAMYYYTAAPCRYGHDSPRATNGGRCVECTRKRARENWRRYKDKRDAARAERKAQRIAAAGGRAGRLAAAEVELDMLRLIGPCSIERVAGALRRTVADVAAKLEPLRGVEWSVSGRIVHRDGTTTEVLRGDAPVPKCDRIEHPAPTGRPLRWVFDLAEAA